jgi:hypothetical protein
LTSWSGRQVEARPRQPQTSQHSDGQRKTFFFSKMLHSGKRKMFLAVFLLCNAASVLGYNTIQYNQYKYIGFRNTWHDGAAHEV